MLTFKFFIILASIQQKKNKNKFLTKKTNISDIEQKIINSLQLKLIKNSDKLLKGILEIISSGLVKKVMYPTIDPIPITSMNDAKIARPDIKNKKILSFF